MAGKDGLRFARPLLPLRQLPVAFARRPEVDVFGGELLLEKFLQIGTKGRETVLETESIWTNMVTLTCLPRMCAIRPHLPAAFRRTFPTMRHRSVRLSCRRYHRFQPFPSGLLRSLPIPWKAYPLRLPHCHRPCTDCSRSWSSCSHRRSTWCTRRSRRRPARTAAGPIHSSGCGVRSSGIATTTGPSAGMAMRCD